MGTFLLSIPEPSDDGNWAPPVEKAGRGSGNFASGFWRFFVLEALISLQNKQDDWH